MASNPVGCTVTLKTHCSSFFQQERPQDGPDPDGLGRRGNWVSHWVPQPRSRREPPPQSVLLKVHHLSAVPPSLRVYCHLSAKRQRCILNGCSSRVEYCSLPHSLSFPSIGLGVTFKPLCFRSLVPILVLRTTYVKNLTAFYFYFVINC